MTALTQQLLRIARHTGGYFQCGPHDRRYYADAALIALPAHYQRTLVALYEAADD